MRTDRKHRRSGQDGSFWLSFSDLMSSLVLIIILVMFYIIYQYFNEAETNARVIAAREAELDTTQAELTAAQNDLVSAQAELKVQQDLVVSREEELATAQADLDTATTALNERETQVQQQQSQLDSLSQELAGKQTEIETQQQQLLTQQQLLETQQSQLSSQREQLNSQQAQLDSQQAQLDSQQQQIEQLVGMRTRIVSSISSAFKANNINATVDPTSGSIALESDVLFVSGESEITDSGQHFLDKILPIYLEVLFSPEYRPYVKEIIVEGHTDSDGDWLTNLQLSQQRAYAVTGYVLGRECTSITADMKNSLREIITVNGRSYSDRIFNANGVENKDASRRVVFKFRLTDEQMITQLQQILENEGVD